MVDRFASVKSGGRAHIALHESHLIIPLSDNRVLKTWGTLLVSTAHETISVGPEQEANGSGRIVGSINVAAPGKDKSPLNGIVEVP